MKVIWKFPVLDLLNRYTTRMPAGAEILSVQMQDDRPQMWLLVDPKAEGEPRTFESFGTGHPVKAQIVQYLGTLQVSDGALIFHVFEVKP